MSHTQVTRAMASEGTAATGIAYRLEVVVVPVADFDRARKFFMGLGWRVDVDVDVDGAKFMHITPPGSMTSVVFGTAVTAAPPGSADGLLLAVDNLDEAREDLVSRGVEVSEIFHDEKGGNGAGFRIGNAGRAAGRDPENRTYASYASFHDTEGNRWILQEVTERLPGRLW